MANQVQYKFESRPEFVLEIGESIKARCIQLGMSELDAYQVQTAVSEAMNNAILHAYGDQPGHEVVVEFSALMDELKIDVIDKGKRMTEMPPDVEPPLDAESGRGWWIMRRWMDQVDYSSNGSENCLSLRRKL